MTRLIQATSSVHQPVSVSSRIVEMPLSKRAREADESDEPDRKRRVATSTDDHQPSSSIAFGMSFDADHVFCTSC